MRVFAASFLIVFSVLSEVAFVAFRAFAAPAVTVLLALGATLGICLAVSSAACNVSPAAFAVSSTALVVSAAKWLSLTSLAVSLISFVVSLVAVASCTAFTSSVIAPLSRNFFYCVSSRRRYLTNSLCYVLHLVRCLFRRYFP